MVGKNVKPTVKHANTQTVSSRPVTLAAVNNGLSGHAPFLKWAGGKRQLLDKILPLVPKFERYHEPFLGGGALFFALVGGDQKFNAVVGDTNRLLIDTYIAVRDDVESLIDLLANYELEYFRNPRVFYYALRDNFTPNSKLSEAARFIALNRTCYNGLYRVNSKGAFNVPMGRYKHPHICNEQMLRNASKALQASNVRLMAADYEETLEGARAGDFVYLDPPFSPETPTANFVSYTKSGFDDAEQKRLSRVFRILDKRGCVLMLSNSGTDRIRELYSDYSKTTIATDVLRSINCKAAGRADHKELLICNYELAPLSLISKDDN